VHVRHELPDEIVEVVWTAEGDTIHLPALISLAWGVSTSEARRGLGQGAVRVDGEAVAAGVLDLPAAALDGRVLQYGKRRFARVRVVRSAQ
jgi:tyrosyl-tRNA synthetase